MSELTTKELLEHFDNTANIEQCEKCKAIRSIIQHNVLLAENAAFRADVERLEAESSALRAERDGWKRQCELTKKAKLKPMWIVQYRCGCSVGPLPKKEILEYCGIHGNDVQTKYPVWVSESKRDKERS